MNFQDFKNLNKVPTYNVFFFYHFSENSHFLVHNLVLKLKRQVIRKHSERKLLTILLFRYVCISRKKIPWGRKFSENVRASLSVMADLMWIKCLPNLNFPLANII